METSRRPPKGTPRREFKGELQRLLEGSKRFDRATKKVGTHVVNYNIGWYTKFGFCAVILHVLILYGLINDLVVLLYTHIDHIDTQYICALILYVCSSAPFVLLDSHTDCKNM